jgi:hypothetical protein
MIKNYSQNYILKYWVGLLDGDGSIQVNHWKKKNLHYRIIIKLKNHSDNVIMLNLIQTYIGGRVRFSKNSNNHIFVFWVVDSRKSFLEILQILRLYPPKTTRLKAQLNFALECLAHNNVDLYLNTRNNKYLNFSSTINLIDIDPFFEEWLSGFIEIEGCFSIRQNLNCSFSIGQNNDLFLLEKIRTYFGIVVKPRCINSRFWLLETYRRESLINIIAHFLKYPLIGEKKISFNKFKEFIN